MKSAEQEIIIRKIESKDIPEVARLLKEMWLLHAEEEPKLLSRDYIDSYDVTGYVTRYSKDPNHQIFVAEVDGKVVGTGRAEIMSAGDKMYNFNRMVYLDDLSVDEDYRGRGIADFLVEARLKFARDKGIMVCHSKIYSFNDRSKNLARKHGFKDIYSLYYKFLGE